MYMIALKMLQGDRAKYWGLIFGVCFATLLMAQQISIFVCLLARAASIVYSVDEADIWAMDKRVCYIEEVEPMRDIEIYNVRSVEGVQWAVPFYKGLSVIRMHDGHTQQVQLIGIDVPSMIGGRQDTIMGNSDAIKKPCVAMMDRNGYRFTWPNQPLALGKCIELNDHRIVIEAIANTMPTFFTFPVLYVSYNTALKVTPPLSKKLSFVLIKAKKGQNLQHLAKRIALQTGLKVLKKEDFAWQSIQYILQRTGIPINFGITIGLGILVGAAITAQTFYMFVMEHAKQFAAMKAIGLTNGQLFRMVLFQASVVGAIGYSIGIGLTALFFESTKNTPALQGFFLRFEVIAGVFFVIFMMSASSILFSLRKVFKLDPAIVFRG